MDVHNEFRKTYQHIQEVIKKQKLALKKKHYLITQTFLH